MSADPEVIYQQGRESRVVPLSVAIRAAIAANASGWLPPAPTMAKRYDVWQPRPESRP